MDCQSSNCSPHFAHRYWYVGIAVLGSRAPGDRRWHSLYSTANPTGVPGVLLLLPLAYLLGFAAVIGHVLPITFRFRGGRGVATAGGVLAVIYPLIALGLALLWFVIARGFGKASVASIVITVAFPVLVAVTGNSWGDILVTSGLALVILARHVPNLRRLLRGEEHGLGPDPPGGSVSE